MKKLIPIIFGLGLISLILQFFIQGFIKHHEKDYSIITDDNSYMINEKFNVKDKEHVYSFNLKDKKSGKNYLFDFSHDYNKQDSIIKDVKFYEYEELFCLFPIYKDGHSSDLVCNYKGKQVSNSYLKQIGNKDIKKIISKLKKGNYKADTWKDDTTPTTMENYKLYNENIPNNIIFTMWFYQGFYRITNDEVEPKIFLNKDHYENDMSYVVGDFLVSINTDDIMSYGYSDFYIFDIVNGGKIKVDFEEKLSKNMYFNGVYEDKLYYTDLDKKKQYSLDPKYEKVEEVGNVEDGFKKLEGRKLVNISAKDYLEDKVYFQKDNITNNKLKEMYGAKEIKKDGNMYYFYSDDGNFYKTYITDIKHPILLFNFDSISEWIVKNGNVMVVSKNMMYFYNDKLGLLPILENDELNYNYKNICSFVEK